VVYTTSQQCSKYRTIHHTNRMIRNDLGP